MRNCFSLWLREPANIVFLVLLMFLIHLVSVIKCVTRHVRLTKLGWFTENSNINTKFSIVGISETWLKNSSHLVDIDGYNFVQNHRTEKCGGGVGLYLSLDLEFKSSGDLMFPKWAINGIFIHWNSKIQREKSNCRYCL